MVPGWTFILKKCQKSDVKRMLEGMSKHSKKLVVIINFTSWSRRASEGEGCFRKLLEIICLHLSEILSETHSFKFKIRY